MKYALTREAALGLLQEYASIQGLVRLSIVREVFLEPKPTELAVDAVYRKAVSLGILPRDMALDPRTARILALDT